MDDFLIAVEAIRASREETWQQTRALAFVMAKPYLKNKNMTVERFWPLPSDKVSPHGFISKRKRVSQMTHEERQEWAKSIAEHVKNSGITNNN